MLIETVLQFIGPMLPELAIREVAIPAGKQLIRGGPMQGTTGAVDAGVRGGLTSVPFLSPVRAVQIVSAVSGRVRVEVAGLRGDAELARKLSDEIGALSGVIEAQANARTGRMLVTFEPMLHTGDAVASAIDRARALHLHPAASQTRRLAAVV